MGEDLPIMTKMYLCLYGVRVGSLSGLNVGWRHECIAARSVLCLFSSPALPLGSAGYADDAA